MPTLVIVESPAKARTIKSFLGKDYRVEASYGHVRDLPAGKKEVPEEFRSEKWAEFGVNVEKDFEPIYVIAEGKKKQISELKKALKDADRLLLATDEDREGESISWHLNEILNPKNKIPAERIVFHEITREAIQQALEHPRQIDEDLVRAQETRRILDRLFGYTLSPVLWRKVQPGLSAGRVQSVAVRLIVEREEERRSFVKSAYWDLEAEVGSPAGSFKATLISLAGKRLASGRDFDPSTGELKSKDVTLLTEPASRDLRKELDHALPWEVTRVEEKPGKLRPYPPFTTSTLQQEAYRKLRFTAKRTMSIAQRLYEGVNIDKGGPTGLITYMRTDSVTLSQKALGDAQSVIRRIYGGEFARGPRVYKTKQANAQEAHEAIRPTEISRTPTDLRDSGLSKEELALYELIWKRTVASQMPDADILRTSVEITARTTDKKPAVFTASGKKILFAGFLRAYVEGSDDPAAEIGDKEVVLPDLKEGQQVHRMKGRPAEDDLHLLHLNARDHETQPPARYTEASLVKKLEEESIGRPSTYATIISTIQDRGYVHENKSGQLIPTFTAMAVTQLLRQHFPEYVDIKFTARMEEELDEIAGGRIHWLDHMRAFYRGTGGSPGLESQVGTKAPGIDFPRVHIGKDPDSGVEINVRIGRYGPYIQRGENGSGTIANIPKGLSPAELTVDKALSLINAREEGPRNLGSDPGSGLTVYAMTGRFGAYVQLGETPDDKKAPKPKRASLERGMEYETVDLETALALLAFPKELGKHPESGEPVIANKGKFGPYVQHRKDFRSLKKEDDLQRITFARALELLAEPKSGRGASRSAAKTVLRELGENKDGVKIQVLDGRYGPYVSDGKSNATLPKDLAPDDVSLERATELLAAKKGSRPKAKRPATKKPKKQAGK